MHNAIESDNSLKKEEMSTAPEAELVDTTEKLDQMLYMLMQKKI